MGSVGDFISHIDSTSVLTGALSIVSILYPPAAPIIGIIEKAAPYIIAAKPLISAAISEGPGAFAAAEKAAPQLADAINQLKDHLMAAGKTLGSGEDITKENLTRVVFGFKPMTTEEEAKWMDDFTPMSNKDSRFGGG